MRKILCLIFSMFFLSGCQNTGLFLANLPNDATNFTVRKDVAYGPKSWQRLDIYRPAGTSAPVPVIVFYYGGSWVKGSKEQYAFVANRFTREGYAVVIPDYAKYPPSVYPAFVEDAARVSHWLQTHGTEANIDLERVFLMGHSAGAHIGAMLIADARYLDRYDMRPDFYRAFIGIAGPYDFVPGSQRYKAIFGPEERYPLMQATRFIDGSEPPMFLLTAGLDWLVSDSNTAKLEAAIRKDGGEVRVQRYPVLGHLTILGSFSAILPYGGIVAKDIIRFMENI